MLAADGVIEHAFVVVYDIGDRAGEAGGSIADAAVVGNVENEAPGGAHLNRGSRQRRGPAGHIAPGRSRRREDTGGIDRATRRLGRTGPEIVLQQ